MVIGILPVKKTQNLNLKMTNTFLSNTFQNTWKAHFKPNSTILGFKFINGLKFYKSKLLPVFFNVGRNLTKGNSYQLINAEDYKNKTIVVYDVLPDKGNPQETLKPPSKVKVYKSVQYSGFLVNLENFQDMDAYMKATFGKNSRMKMRKYSRRLDACFNISTKMFHGHIDKKEYDLLFEQFMDLLKKRYSEKQVTYNNMQPDEWSFYKDVAYPLILEKKASLFVVYDNQKPIAITYNYHDKGTVIDAITVFDTDYSKFNIGYINNLKLLHWCFDNNIKILDFSKGYFDYKKRMCTLQYNFEYHIIYDNSSIISKFIAYSYYRFFEFKAYLREKHINEKLHQITYKIRRKNDPQFPVDIKITNLDCTPKLDNLSKIDVQLESNYKYLKKAINNFLYNIEKPLSEIEIFKNNNIDGSYIISNKDLIQEVRIIT